MKKLNIRKGDNVMIISGESKGSVGVVKQVIYKKNRVLVEGEQITKKITKHLKPDAKSPEGSIVKQDFPFHISNIMLIDPKSKKPQRINRKEVEGKKVRYFKKSGEILS